MVGGGGAGFAAAITAANAGKSVVLLEKMGVFGGDTALSGGEMAAPGNWIQVQEGIADSPDALAKDMLEGGDNAGDPALVQIIAEGALDSSQWLTFEGGISWKHDLMQFGGHNTKRSIIPITHSGSEMTTKLTKRAGEIDTLTLAKNSPAVELVKSGDAITGVKVKNTVTGKESTIACKAVVLASGGFGSNIDMRVKYNPAMDDSILSTDSVGATGDGITMGEAAGANLIDMQYIQTYPVCDPETGSLLYVGDVRLESRAIMVNKEGDRFVEELDRRDVLSNAIVEQTDGKAYMLFNQANADETGLLVTHEDEYENLEARKVIVKGDTLEAVRALRRGRRRTGEDRGEVEPVLQRRQRPRLQLPRRLQRHRRRPLLPDGLQAGRALHHGRSAYQHRRAGPRRRRRPHSRPVRRRRGGRPQDGHEPPGLLLDVRHLHVRTNRR